MKKNNYIRTLLFFIAFSIFGTLGVFNKSALAINNNSENQLTLLNVVRTWTTLDELTWERHAIIKVAPGYQLYEAAIWEDSVRLYKFDSSFDSGKLSKEYRESFLVSSYPIPGGRDSQNSSKYISEAFKDIFKIMITKSPAKQYGIKYTGHGSGNGYMFASMINTSDTQDFLKYATELLGRKIDFYDMSSNCNQGTVPMLNAFYPYFDYVLASELATGGYRINEEYKRKFLEVFEFNRYPSIFNTNRSLEEKLEELVNLKRKEWTYSKKNMVENKIKQSVSLFKTSHYKPLMEQARQLLKNKNISVSSYNNDLKTVLESAQNRALTENFNKFVLARQTNKDFFTWNVNTDALVIDSMDDILKFDKYEKKLPSVGTTTEKPKVTIIDTTTKKPKKSTTGTTTKKPKKPTTGTTTKKPKNPTTDTTGTNNSFNTAIPVPLTATVSGRFTAAVNRSYFSFDVKNTGLININVKDKNNTGIAWLVYNESDLTKYIAYPHKSNDGIVGSFTAKPGKYYICVYSYSRSDGDYTLNIN